MASGPVIVQNRLWFNEANESRYFLVPGLIVLIMTLIGALLTALVMAREWERGTLEALFVTPVRAGEILLGKTIPVLRAGHDRTVHVPSGGEISFPGSVPWLGGGAHGRLDALSARGTGHRALDLSHREEPIRRQPDCRCWLRFCRR